eukprot:7480067-Pyramimonas_sp.AAC.1
MFAPSSRATLVAAAEGGPCYRKADYGPDHQPFIDGEGPPRHLRKAPLMHCARGQVSNDIDQRKVRLKYPYFYWGGTGGSTRQTLRNACSQQSTQ